MIKDLLIDYVHEDIFYNGRKCEGCLYSMALVVGGSRERECGLINEGNELECPALRDELEGL